MKSLADLEDIKINRNISQNNGSVQKYYEIINKIGKGSFGSVFKVLHKASDQFRAMKVIKKDTVNLQDDEKTFLKEIEILIKVDHPNIIKIYEYFTDDINYYLIIEYVSGGELYDTITAWKDFNEKKAAYIMKQILSAVNYLHSFDIIHRDLKPENMLVENKKKGNLGDEEINIKIIDFGTCNFIGKGGKLSLKVGSPYYIAPEVLKRNYNAKCDLWSCGIILYVLLVGYPPFTGKTTDELLSNVSKGEYKMDGSYWSSISKNAKNLVKSLLDLDPNKRLTAQQALDHPWILDNNKIELSNNILSFQSVLKNIRNFNAGEKFQQATIAYIVHFLCLPSEMDELKKVFQIIDINKDGKLTYSELKNGFEKVVGSELSGIELNKIISEMDSNSDGFISYEEFLRVAINKKKLLDEKNLQLAFDCFDENKDGKLSAEEIKKVLGTSHQQYVTHLISAIDEDDNQVIDFEEFKNLMNSLLLQHKNNTIFDNLDTNEISNKKKDNVESISKSNPILESKEDQQIDTAFQKKQKSKENIGSDEDSF